MGGCWSDEERQSGFGGGSSTNVGAYGSETSIRLTSEPWTRNRLLKKALSVSFWIEEILGPDAPRPYEVHTTPPGSDIFCALRDDLRPHDDVVVLNIVLRRHRNPYPCDMHFAISGFAAIPSALKGGGGTATRPQIEVVLDPGEHEPAQARELYRAEIEDYECARRYAGITKELLSRKRMPAETADYEFLRRFGMLYRFMVANAQLLDYDEERDATPLVLPVSYSRDTAAGTPRRGALSSMGTGEQPQGIVMDSCAPPVELHSSSSVNAPTTSLATVKEDHFIVKSIKCAAAIQLLHDTVLNKLHPVEFNTQTLLHIHGPCTDADILKHLRPTSTTVTPPLTPTSYSAPLLPVTPRAPNPGDLLGSFVLDVTYVVVVHGQSPIERSVDCLV